MFHAKCRREQRNAEDGDEKWIYFLFIHTIYEGYEKVIRLRPYHFFCIRVLKLAYPELRSISCFPLNLIFYTIVFAEALWRAQAIDDCCRVQKDKINKITSEMLLYYLSFAITQSKLYRVIHYTIHKILEVLVIRTTSNSLRNTTHINLLWFAVRRH